MFKPNFSFMANDLKQEAEYICFLAKNISLGRYQNNGFFVLPYPSAFQASVHFPDLSYSAQFWKNIQRDKTQDYGKKFSNTAVNEVLKSLKKRKSSSAVYHNKQQLLAHWQKEKKGFLATLNRFFHPCEQLTKIKEIKVLLTEYGAHGSFNLLKKNGYWQIACTCRIDLPISSLIRIVLLALYNFEAKKRAEIGEIPWYERQAVVDYLIKHGQFQKLLEPYVYKTKRNLKNFNKYLKESNEYVTTLGFPLKIKIGIIRNKVFVNSLPTQIRLTGQESKLLSYMIGRVGNVVSFDEAAVVVWEEKSFEKFSLYSLAKIIENIRTKFRQAKLNTDLIKTIRGQGYLLTC